MLIENAKKMFFIIIGVCIFVSLLSGYLSAYFIIKSKALKVYTVDVREIVELKKAELAKRWVDKKEEPEQLEKEFASFLTRLDSILNTYFADKSILYIRKEAIIDGNYKDITEEVKNKVYASK